MLKGLLKIKTIMTHKFFIRITSYNVCYTKLLRQPFFFDLPYGGEARICTKKDTYPDGKEFVGIGIKPDIEVSKSLSDYLENNDPVLEKAIEFLKDKNKRTENNSYNHYLRNN